MLTLLEVAVWARYAALVWVAWLALRHDRGAEAGPAASKAALRIA